MADYELRSVQQGQLNRPPFTKLQPQDVPEHDIVGPQKTQKVALPNLSMNQSRPVDKYNIVFSILLLHGIGTLMPWNAFINAQQYFRDYKLALPSNATLAEPGLQNAHDNFLLYLSIVAQIPNVIFNGLNLFINMDQKGVKSRVNAMLAVEAILFIITITLSIVDTSQWKMIFFYLTLVIVGILNMSSGIYQNCVYGIGAKFTGSYTNAILIGNNLCGTVTSIVNLICIWLATAPSEAAFYYFITAFLIILACIVSYNLLHINKFYRYHYDGYNSQIETANESSRELMTRIRDDDVPESFRETVDSIVPKVQSPDDSNELVKSWNVLKKCWPQCLNVFITFSITLALFPAVLADIEQLQQKFQEKYFSSFACFFVFNVFAMVGNLISSKTTWPGKDRVWIMVVARFLFVPFFLLCNYHPNTRRWPVIIENDRLYIVGNILFALSSGYLSSLCMMFASDGLNSEEASKAGMLAAFFLVFGILIGAIATFFLAWIVTIG